MRNDKNEIWFSNYFEAEQYCYENNLWVGGIEHTLDRFGQKWSIVGEDCHNH